MVSNPGAGGAVEPTPFLITPASRLSLGPELILHTVETETDPTGTTSWPSANRAIFVPFVLAESVTVVKLFIQNGNNASGNVDVGIYNSAGVRLVSSGSTAQVGVNQVQEFDITDTVLGPGRFYLAVAKSDATGVLFRWLTAVPDFMESMGVLLQNTAFPLPDPATFAVWGNLTGYVPYVGLSLRTLLT